VRAAPRQVELEVLIKPLDELIEGLALLVVEALVREDAVLHRVEVALGRPGAFLRLVRTFVPAPSLDAGFFGSAQGHFQCKLFCFCGLRGGRQKHRGSQADTGARRLPSRSNQLYAASFRGAGGAVLHKSHESGGASEKWSEKT
jgi:hypothetical protein